MLIYIALVLQKLGLILEKKYIKIHFTAKIKLISYPPVRNFITHLTIVYIKFILPSSLTRCPVAKSWDMTSGGKLLPPVEIEVEVLLEEEVFEEEASGDLPKKDNNNLITKFNIQNNFSKRIYR